VSRNHRTGGTRIGIVGTRGVLGYQTGLPLSSLAWDGHRHATASGRPDVLRRHRGRCIESDPPSPGRSAR
jgi:hypothetical protein